MAEAEARAKFLRAESDRLMVSFSPTPAGGLTPPKAMGEHGPASQQGLVLYCTV